MVQVGGLAVRWVLTQHAEPWFLTLQSKRAYCHPTCNEPKTQSSTRKRSRREAPQETGCPAKRPTVDTGEAEERKKPPRDATEARKDEEELRNEGKDEGNGGKLMNLEEDGGQQTQPGDVGEKKKTDSAEEQEKIESGVRDDEEEAHSPAAALCGADDE